jgi:predicted ArsR family transcriptional regulator
MQTSKQQLLALLKRTGSVTVEEAAGALAVASMTARQHLVGLEKDGLVQAERVRRANGRPHYLYRLTDKGDNDAFPRRYDLFAQVLLEEVGLLDPDEIYGLSPDEKRMLIVQRTADRVAERYRFPVEGRPLEERVAAVTGILHQIGGFAEWCSSEAGLEIRDYNCFFSRLGQEQVSDCQWHVRLLTQLLGWPVRHEVLVSGYVECCRYLVCQDVDEELQEGLPANV